MLLIPTNIIRIIIASTPSGQWCATLDGKALCVSSAPLLASARILIASGYDPAAIVDMWRERASALLPRGRLGVLAGLTVKDRPWGPTFERWVPFSVPPVEPAMRLGALVGVEHRPKRHAAAGGVSP